MCLSIDAGAREHALGVVVLHFLHIGHEVGCVDQLLWRVTAGNNHFCGGITMGCISFSFICAVLGLIATDGSFWGTFIGGGIGYLIDSGILGNKSQSRGNKSQSRRNTRAYAREEQIGFNDFLYNLIFLSADVIFADGRIYESETAFLRSSLTQSFGTDTAIKGMNVFARLKALRRRRHCARRSHRDSRHGRRTQSRPKHGTAIAPEIATRLIKIRAYCLCIRR